MNQYDDRPRASLRDHIRDTEADLFASFGAEVEERFLELERTGVLSHGSGRWSCCTACRSAPPRGPRRSLNFQGFQLLAVDLPGHGLSDPVRYQRGHVREHAHRLVDDILDALGLDSAPVIGHSLGGMFALWHAAAGADRISALIAVGVPAVALPRGRVRMPLSPLTVRGIGVAVLRSPSPRWVYRRLLTQGLGAAEVKMAPDSLIEALRLSARQPENARTVASLMHASRR